MLCLWYERISNHLASTDLTDDTAVSSEWERVLSQEGTSINLEDHTVAVKLQAGSQEAAFLQPICSVNSTPAIVVIK